MATNINNLASEIARQLQQYSNVLKEDVEKAAEEVADEGVQKLKAKSPKRYGRYASSWTKKKVGTKWILHNSKHYQLTHLLEKGHAKVKGGRVPAVVHIKPVEEFVVDEFIRKVEEAARQ